MKIRSLNLETVCGVTSKLPENTLPEVAFAGKSNVGKSSLINAVVNRKSFARVSSEPGKTQTINFYNINEEVYLVDLPGYGYAKAGKKEVEAWGQLIERYLNTSEMLRAVFLLVDIRHAPSANDKQMFEWMKFVGYDPIVIATKMDKIKRSQIDKQIKLIRQGLGADKDTIVVPVSSETKQGIDTIQDFFDQIVENEADYQTEDSDEE